MLITRGRQPKRQIEFLVAIMVANSNVIFSVFFPGLKKNICCFALLQAKNDNVYKASF